jgi:hypothetical protein
MAFEVHPNVLLQALGFILRFVLSATSGKLSGKNPGAS